MPASTDEATTSTDDRDNVTATDCSDGNRPSWMTARKLASALPPRG